MIFKTHFFILLCLVGLLAGSLAAETLADLQQETLQKNLEIIAAKNRYLAATKLPIQEGTLPDPTVSFTDLGVGRPFSGLSDSDFAYLGVGVSQELPFPGKLSLRSQIAEKKAQILRQEYRSTAVRLLSELKTAFYEYVYLQQATEIAGRYRELLRNFTDISQARYKVGQGLQQDVLRAQLEQSTIEEKLLLLEQDLQNSQANLNSLLNRDVNAPLKVEEDFAPPVFAPSLQDLQQKLNLQSPEILAKLAQQDQKNLELSLAKKDRYPDFAASFQWQKTGSAFPDYYMATIEARIPLYSWRKQKPAIAQATLELEGSKKETESARKKLEGELKQAYTTATTSAKLVKLYNEGIVPQSRLSLQSAVSAYQVGKIDFLTMLNSATTVLNYESEYIRRTADHHKAVARIEQITGQFQETANSEIEKELGNE